MSAPFPSKSKPEQVAEEGVLAVVRSRGPFDLRLSLAAAASFLPITGAAPALLTMPVDAGGRCATVTIWQVSRKSSLVHASATPPIEKARLRRIAKWLISSDLDLRPFYKLVAAHSVMGPVAASLRGLKPLRPPTLFEMAIIAITEQQLSLAAAFHIRARLVSRFGIRIDGLWTFPSPERLAAASLHDLSQCGLSRRKAEYVKGLAERVSRGLLNFNALKQQSDARIREELLAMRGFGDWSVQYIMARGFGRPDALPSQDVGLRRVIGHSLARGRRLTPSGLERVLAPFKPFRSLAAYYLAVHWRLRLLAERGSA